MANSMGPCWACAESDKEKAIDDAVRNPGVGEMAKMMRGVTAETMVLLGIALVFLFQALLALLQYIASEQALQQVVEEHGVNYLAAICAICKSQFTKVLPYYKQPMDMIGSVHGLVARAIVLGPKP